MRALTFAAWFIAALPLISLHVGCSDDGTQTGTSKSGEDGAVADALDAGQTDGAQAVDQTAADIEKPPPQCPGEAGCPCVGNGDCDDGACIDTPDGRVCAATCVETCSKGKSCVTIKGGSDLQAYCVPTYGVPCRPCGSADDCDSPAAFSQHCIDYGSELGAFCGNQCSDDAACPANFTCKLAKKIGGGQARACVRKAGKDGQFGLCECSVGAAAAGLSTTCWAPVVDQKGDVVQRCKGERTCASGVLSGCVAFTGKNEECIDTQCAGKPDGAACDDGQPCTIGDACTAGICKPDSNVCECKSTADCAGKQAELSKVAGKCAPQLYCDVTQLPWACKELPASIVTCSGFQDTVCAKNQCDPATGKCALKGVTAGTKCDDGNACTADDACDGGGKCAGVDKLCQCKTSADCANLEDGNACNGTMYCKVDGGSNKCAINPASLVSCPLVDWIACKSNGCNKKTGVCELTDLADAAACSDGQPCTSGDHCKAGKCVPGANTCKCTKDAECAKHDDGDKCNGVHFCDVPSGACKHNPATVVSCPTVDDTACVKNRCNSKTGACAATVVNNNGVCSDDNPCTASDKCDGGLCKGGTNLCACKDDADCAKQDDGDLCNGTLYCEKTLGGSACKLNPATRVKCQTVDDTVCAHNVCAKKTGKCGMVPRNPGAACEADGNPCTANDSCKDGKCAAGTNVCACQKDSDCAKQEDGDLCNGTLYCDNSGPTPSCKPSPASVVVCNKAKDTACVTNQCDPKTGKCALANAEDNSPCDDGNPATKADSCAGGQCYAGVNISVCSGDGDCAAWDDGDKCDGALTCKAGKCEVTLKTAVQCSSSGPCDVQVCDPATGKCAVVPPADNACDDGDKCTTGEGCKDGKCAVGQKTDCDDQNTCTDDSCNPNDGQCMQMPTNAACEDGDKCTANDKCELGKCVAGKANACDDGNVCTNDVCKEGKCTNAKVDGAACKLASACFGVSVCKQGVCEAGPKTECKGGTACKPVSCEEPKGCVTKSAPLSTPCDDGNACTDKDACEVIGCIGQDRKVGDACDDGEPCTVETKCQGSQFNLKCLGLPKTNAQCTDNNDCTTDQCEPGKGCVHQNAQDGETCVIDTNTGGTCKAGKCVATASKCGDGNVDQGEECDDSNKNNNDGCSNLCKFETCITWQVKTVAGKAGTPGNSDGAGESARFTWIADAAVDSNDNVFVIDRGAHNVRRVDANGKVITVAGFKNLGSGHADGVDTVAKLSSPRHGVIGPSGSLLLTEYDNQVVRKLTVGAKTLLVSTFAGTKYASNVKDGALLQAQFNVPFGIARKPGGGFYVTDENGGTVRELDVGTVSTIAGIAGSAGFADGKGSVAKFHGPAGLVVGPSGQELLVADRQNHRIRRVNLLNQEVSTVAGTGTFTGPYNDGKGTQVQLYWPVDLGVLSNGLVLFTDEKLHCVRALDPQGNIKTVAGACGQNNYGHQDGTNTGAKFYGPLGVGSDGKLQVFIADKGNYVLRKVFCAAF